jgi:Rrf2 family protein
MQLPLPVYYAAKVISYLNSHRGDIVTIREVAQAERLQPNTLAKVVQQLAQAGELVAQRGPGGGLSLPRSGREISLLQIVEAVSGPMVPKQCPISATICLEQEMCAFHLQWQEIHRSLAITLRRIEI